MQTKTREALNVILNSEDYEIFEALELLQEHVEVDTDLTKEEIQELERRLNELEANGFKGISLEEFDERRRARDS
ncbi:MAG: addiction module protein [Planctomycetota bacterium]